MGDVRLLPGYCVVAVTCQDEPVSRRRSGVRQGDSDASTDPDAADDMPGQTAVIFSVPEKRLSAMDVATGPCVPAGGRKHALVSVHQQEGPERPDQMAALYSVLTGQSGSEALRLVDEKNGSTLYLCSDAFVDVMADTNQLLVRLGDADKERGDRSLSSFAAKMAELDAAWMSAGSWHSAMVSARTRLLRMGKARIAREKGQPLYCWYGPQLREYIVIRGRGPYPPQR
jgi:hypothetical protein